MATTSPVDAYGNPVPADPGSKVIVDSSAQPHPMRTRLLIPGATVIDDPAGDVTQLQLTANCAVFNGADVGGAGPFIDHGLWCPNPSVDIGPCFWRVWVKRGTVGGYFATINDGGAHSVLLGFDASGNLTGNTILTNGANPSVGSQTCDAVQVGEWVEVTWEQYCTPSGATAGSGYILLRINGIAVGRSATTASRAASSGAGNHLWIGGHGHDTPNCSLGWLSIWDRGLFADGNGDAAAGLFQALPVVVAPENVRACTDGVTALGSFPPDFFCDYGAPLRGGQYQDTSGTIVSIYEPWNAGKTYPVRSEVVGPDGIYYYSIYNAAANLNNTPASSPTWWTAATRATLPSSRGTPYHHGQPGTDSANGIQPRQAFDPTFPPAMAAPRTISNALVTAPKTPPVLNAAGGAGFIAYDTFGRAPTSLINFAQTDPFEANAEPTIGTTEVGAKAWGHAPNGGSGEFGGHGIRNGSIHYLGPSQSTSIAAAQSIAFVDTGITNHGVQMRLPAGALAGTSAAFPYGCGPSVRYADIGNMIYMFLDNNGVSLVKFVAFVATTIIARTTFAANWTHLALTASGSDLLTMYAGYGDAGSPEVVTWVAIASVIDATGAANTKAGVSFGWSGSFGRVSEFGAFSV